MSIFYTGVILFMVGWALVALPAAMVREAVYTLRMLSEGAEGLKLWKLLWRSVVLCKVHANT